MKDREAQKKTKERRSCNILGLKNDTNKYTTTINISNPKHNYVCFGFMCLGVKEIILGLKVKMVWHEKLASFGAYLLIGISVLGMIYGDEYYVLLYTITFLVGLWTLIHKTKQEIKSKT